VIIYEQTNEESYNIKRKKEDKGRRNIKGQKKRKFIASHDTN
jgi:hypothetical protein